MNENMPNLNLLNKVAPILGNVEILEPWTIYNLKRMGFFKVVVIGDMHTGSKYGYLPHEAVTKEGVQITQTKWQRTMETNLLSEFKKIGEVDILIVMGDTCEGKQVKIAGITLSDADTDSMVKWATKSILDICKLLKPKIIIAVKGTDYHVSTGIGGDLDYQVASNLAYSGYKVLYGYPTANVRIGNLKWKLKHKYPTAMNITPPMEKVYKEVCADAKAKGYEVPDVFGWGHAHQCVEPHRIYSTSAYAFIAPCLKLNDPHIEEATYVKRPDIGFLYIEQDADGYLNGRFIRIFKQ